MSKEYYVYILTNNANTVMYIGVTNDLIKRVYEHKEGRMVGFTSRYNVNKLVYFEEYNDIKVALKREKQLKNWKREWKDKLVEEENEEYRDLYRDLV